MNGLVVPDQAELWARLERHVARTRGSVGIEKMLGGRSHDAKDRWARTASAFLQFVASVTDVSTVADLHFRVGGATGIDVTLDIAEVRVQSDAGQLSTILWRPAAAVVLSEWAHRTWGGVWTSALDSAVAPRRIVHVEEGEFFPGLRYIAQSPSRLGPHLAASSESLARRGGQAEDLGDDSVKDAVSNMSRNMVIEQ